MAYAQFQELGGARAARRTRGETRMVAVEPAATDRLTELEWSVVAIARRDGRASLRRPGRWTRAVRKLLKQRNPQLADPRLEALRRIAVLSWQHGYVVAPHEVKAFLAAGFTAGQYETVVDGIGAAKARRSAAPARPAGARLAVVAAG